MIMINLNRVKFYQPLSMTELTDKNSMIIFQHIDKIAEETRDENTGM